MPVTRAERLTRWLLAAGALLRVAQYLSNRSLWLDEAYIAPTILKRSFAGLLWPPDYGQIVPVGFLALVRAAVALFGASEYALRLVPLLCGLAALFLFRRVAGRLLPAPAVPIAAALFSFSGPLIGFSSELKQYSSDVLAALFLLDRALDAIGAAGTTAEPRCARDPGHRGGGSRLVLAARRLRPRRHRRDARRGGRSNRGAAAPASGRRGRASLDRKLHRALARVSPAHRTRIGRPRVLGGRVPAVSPALLRRPLLAAEDLRSALRRSGGVRLPRARHPGVPRRRLGPPPHRPRASGAARRADALRPRRVGAPLVPLLGPDASLSRAGALPAHCARRRGDPRGDVAARAGRLGDPPRAAPVPSRALVRPRALPPAREGGDEARARLSSAATFRPATASTSIRRRCRRSTTTGRGAGSRRTAHFAAAGSAKTTARSGTSKDSAAARGASGSSSRIRFVPTARTTRCASSDSSTPRAAGSTRFARRAPPCTFMT